jgi:hypothetical protein
MPTSVAEVRESHVAPSAEINGGRFFRAVFALRLT